MEIKKTYEVPEVLIFAVDEFLSTGGSTDVGGEYPSEWE